MLVLIGVAPAAERKLIASALALLGDRAEILNGHIRLLNEKSALIAAYACL